ncbi:MAG: hypothetical protein M1347_05010 [Chloroflexi bacterium]|nr:hypothetical protein [Chloroflexota bacterium]
MPRTKIAAKAASDARPPKTNMALTLEKKLPAATVALLGAIVRHAEQQGAPLYLVGGCVRDLLLGRRNLDLDLVLEGSAIQLGRTLVKRFGGRLVTHKAFGTAVWRLPEDQASLLRELRVPNRNAGRARLPDFLDLITARRESYPHPAALPRVQFAGIREDQYRRDFTINTLAVRLDGSDAGWLLDSWGGLRDLRAGVLRTLHLLSFSDDPTRILRVLRLAGRLGFKIEKGTRSQLNTFLPVLDQVSGERLRNELELALLEKERVSILQSMQRLHVLQFIHPQLRLSGGAVRALNAAPEKSITAYWDLDSVGSADLGFVLWLMDSSPSQIESIASRLSFRADLREAILAAARLHNLKAKMRKFPASKSVEILERMPALAIYAAYFADQGSDLAERLKLYVRKWRHVQPHTDGSTLRKLGLKPGPSYKRILSQLRAAWLDGKISTAKQEQTLLKKLLDGHC